jgi:hypothetical protein
MPNCSGEKRFCKPSKYPETKIYVTNAIVGMYKSGEFMSSRGATDSSGLNLTDQSFRRISKHNYKYFKNFFFFFENIIERQKLFKTLNVLINELIEI